MIKYCWWNKSWATLLVLHLLVRIYHKGCLCCWREDRCLLFTRRLSEGCTADYVQQVVDALLERGFFSKAQYEKNGILTSESIQDHYDEHREFWRRELAHHLEASKEEGLLLPEIEGASFADRILETILELRLNNATREEVYLFCRTILRGAATRQGIERIDRKR